MALIVNLAIKPADKLFPSKKKKHTTKHTYMESYARMVVVWCTKFLTTVTAMITFPTKNSSKPETI